MTPEELARRKRIQAHLSVAGGTLGLTALGAKGAGLALGRAGKAVHAVKADKTAIGILTGGAGLGGVGAFNFAATQKAEAAGVKPKMVLVKKAYNPERNRERRANVYTGAAIAGTGAGVLRSAKAFNSAGGVGHLKLAGARRKQASDFISRSKTRTGKTAAANIANDTKKASAFKNLSRSHVVSAGKIVRTRGVLVPLGASAALAGTAGAIQRQKKNSGRPYSGWYDGKQKPKFSRVDNTTATSN